jgi:hypothetical protein
MTTDPGDLSNLRNIALPAPISFWPPAPGWWILGVTLLAAALILLAKALAHYRRDAYRRQALRELEAIGPARNAVAAQRISAVLKRAALAAFPRGEVARLSGAPWLAFLDRTGRTEAFSKGPAHMLPALALGAAPTADGETILQEAKRWIRRHRRTEPELPC